MKKGHTILQLKLGVSKNDYLTIITNINSLI